VQLANRVVSQGTTGVARARSPRAQLPAPLQPRVEALEQLSVHCRSALGTRRRAVEPVEAESDCPALAVRDGLPIKVVGEPNNRWGAQLRRASTWRMYARSLMSQNSWRAESRSAAANSRAHARCARDMRPCLHCAAGRATLAPERATYAALRADVLTADRLPFERYCRVGDPVPGWGRGRCRGAAQVVGAVRDSQVTVLSQACRAACAWWKAGSGLSNACPASS
jgi:hypothetical protein